MGVVEFPSETLKPLHNLVGSSRQQSQESVLTAARKSETSHVEERSTPPSSPEQSQISLNVQKSFTRVQSPPNLSDLSSPTSNIGSSSIFDVFQSQLSPKQDDASQI
jgi:hypothetical protein